MSRRQAPKRHPDRVSIRHLRTAPPAPSTRTCPSGKVRFEDRVAADLALADSLRSRAGHRNEIRSYLCRRCEGFHLTSMADGPDA